MYNMVILILIVMALLAVGLLVVVFTEMVVYVSTHVPFVPTAQTDIVEIIGKVPITAADYVYDLGSGNGKVVFAIEQATGARVKGFQLRGWTHWYAKFKKTFTGSKAELVGGNFFDHNWGDATVVYTYLFPFLMKDVGSKVLAECQPGTKVVSRDFVIPNLPLYEEWQTPSGHTMRLYVKE